MTTYYHGGMPGLKPGDRLVPAAPHVTDGCPICVARAEGRNYTVREYRAWMRRFLPDPTAARVLQMLEGAPDHYPVDPPSLRDAVYITPEREYARWYAGRCHGDLYRVEPGGPVEPSTEDTIETYTVPGAVVVAVEERRIHLTRRDRRALDRLWAKADRKAGAR